MVTVAYHPHFEKTIRKISVARISLKTGILAGKRRGNDRGKK
jgi:hypothetical protein